MDSMPHLLLVDDDEDILSLLNAFFRKHGHTVTVAQDGKAMFAALEKYTFDLIILDVMLRHEDGFSLCRRLRTTSTIPIIMLTAVADSTDRVVGLELGADDYLTKPFDQRELLARVKAVLRRTAAAATVAQRDETRPLLCFAGWRLDVVRRELRSTDNTLVLLSSVEFDLLPWLRSRRVPLKAYSPFDEGRILSDRTLAAIGRRHGVSTAQVALAWLLAKPGVIAIPKAGSPEHLRENVAAASLKLDADDLERIDRRWPPPAGKQGLAII